MISSTLKLKMKVDSDKTFETRFKIQMKLEWHVTHEASSYGIILAVLWQSKGLARPSAVLPFHAGQFILCCSSTKPPISGLSIKTVQEFDPMISPQAQPGVLGSFLIVRYIVQVEANKTKGKKE
jgi:hypothetical protein